jgi:hypothetical protein
MNGPEERDQRTEMRDEGMQSFEDEHMKEFEEALARAMRRVEVRAETTAKFLALAAEAERKRVAGGSGGMRLIKFSNSSRVFAMPRPRAWMGGAIAAVLAMGIFVGTHVHEQHERRVVAEQQFETAERITDETLARTREQLERQGINLEQ